MPDTVKPKVPSARRFETAKATLFVDRFMTHFIKFGGISVITVVLGIFIFILWQILPLFRGAQVRELKTVPLEARDYRILGLDEYAELPLLVDSNGGLSFRDLVGDRGLIEADPGFNEVKEFTAVSYNPGPQDLVYGTSDGHFAIVDIQYESTFQDGARTMGATAKAGPFRPLGKPGLPIRQISYGDSGDYKLVAGLQEENGLLQLQAASLTQERTLFGEGEIQVDKTFEFPGQIEGEMLNVLVNRQADSILTSTRAGDIYYFFRVGNQFQLRQKFRPFADLPQPGISGMEFLLGDVSLVLTSAEGVNRLFSLFVPEGGQDRLFGQTKEFPQLTGPATFYAPSLRNKAFLIGHNQQASLRYGTTESTRWEEILPYEIGLARIGGKYDRLVFLDAEHNLHFMELKDPHPEASFKAIFGKLTYEGSNEPKYEWQSTGGSDDFEPKLSLVPLIIGTLKGTFYAMLFAVPIALLAAIYTSQFAQVHFRVFVKPLMEIMASLPSVVLGFLAALWLAPLLEDRVPSIILMVAAIPLIAMSFGWCWSALPVRHRIWVKPGYEFLVFAPIFLIATYACWKLGPAFERLAFTVADPATGARIADFRLWWPQFTGADFQQRNSLVVGFVMGFAVIPIIFTITEDSLSNVPATLRSGSLALGASRWQTALRIILPTASAGIFSALMIGLGRAVGETMIVVMATGNTPIMDWNIFSGMRTLSANIAVELPEAPHHGTLYRTLFLGAMTLFVMTFIVNTAAEILRQRLREKYKLV